jgi:hypothetical protein
MKLILLLASVFVTLNVHAQIDSVNYKGAFPANQPMWTDGWCNWNPDSISYPATNITVSGNITTNTTWTSSNTYLLSGTVYVDSGITLTIQPGTIIRGNDLIANSSLIVKKGGRLIARGTSTNPIVFTSNKPIGSRGVGDWGGVILLGRATMNQGVGFIEGLAAISDHQYGGSDDNDNSGILSYVRIEYGGYVFAQNKEINGLTMGAVGRGTQIDHIQCSFINDDAFEWYGGAVNCKYLVSYRTVDDDFDSDFGYHGVVQYGLSVRDPQLGDPSYSLPSGASTSEGFESDNDAAGSTLQPFTNATFANFTMIGPFRGNNSSIVHPAFRRGARIRRNSQIKIINTIFTDWATGVMIDGVACDSNAARGTLIVRDNLITNYRTRVAERSSTSTFNVLQFIGSNNDTMPSSNMLVRPYDFINPDFRLMPNAIAELHINFAYPNPSTGVVFINVNAPGNLRIWDMTGKTISMQRVMPGTLEITLAPGIYIMQLNGSTAKVIVY